MSHAPVELHPSLGVADAGGGRPGWWMTGWCVLGSLLFVACTLVIASFALGWLGLHDEASNQFRLFSGGSAGAVLGNAGWVALSVVAMTWFLPHFRTLAGAASPMLALAVAAGVVPASITGSGWWLLVIIPLIRFGVFEADGTARVPFPFPSGRLVAAALLLLAFVPIAGRTLTHPLSVEGGARIREWRMPSGITTDPRHVMHVPAGTARKMQLGVFVTNNGPTVVKVDLPEQTVSLRAKSYGQLLAIPASIFPCGKRISTLSFTYRTLGFTGILHAKLERAGVVFAC